MDVGGAGLDIRLAVRFQGTQPVFEPVTQGAPPPMQPCSP